ncbi:MAG: hypothetical protein AAGF56_02045 [Pseudomonadota bacterium]
MVLNVGVGMPKLLISFLVLSAFAFGPASPAQAQSEVCVPGAPAGLFPTLPRGILAGQCTPVWEGTLPQTRTPARIMVADATAVPAGFANQVRRALFAADTRSADLGEPVDVGNELVILITDQGSTSDFGMQTEDDGACYLAIFPDTIAAETAALTLQITMAHEYFHCVQSFTLPDLSDVAARLPDSSHGWVIEGGAEWYGHHVVAGAPHSWQRGFEDGIATAPVNTMSYDAWVFFAWLAQDEGVDQVLGYMRALPLTRLTDQAVYDNLGAAAWSRFARDYAAYQVTTSDGRPINPPNRAVIPTEVVEEDRTLDVARGLGTLARQMVTFESGRWELITPEGVLAYVSPIDGNGDPTGEWTPLDSGRIEVEVACDTSDSLMLVTFGADATPYSYEARYMESTCPLNCERLPEQVDRCLLGTWEYVDYSEQFDNSPFMFIMNRMVSDMGGRIEEFSVNAPVHAFYGDGTYSYDQRTTITGMGIEDGNTIRATLDVEAMQETGRWSSDGRTLLVCPQFEEMIATMTMSMTGPEGGRFTQPMNSSGPIDDEPSVRARYTCAGDTLIIRPSSNPFFANMREIRAQRLSGPVD